MRDPGNEVLCLSSLNILVPRGRAPFGQHQKSRPLARSNTGSPRFTDFPSLCACSELSLTNVIGSGLNLLCLQSHSKPECRWTGPEVVIFGADQKERGLWGRECSLNNSATPKPEMPKLTHAHTFCPYHGPFVLSPVSLASRNQDGGQSDSTIDIYEITEK